VFSTSSPILWTAFIAFVLLALAVDLGVFHRQARTISLREAAMWSVIWVVVSLAFNFFLLRFSGRTAALNFFAGYVIEKSLSVDTLFVFVLLFRYFAVESRYQHRVLYWGVLGALIMRGVLIGMGVALISRVEWILYLFGAFLVYTGARMTFEKTQDVHPERNPLFRWARNFLPMTKKYEGQRIFVRKEGAWRATPLFLVLFGCRGDGLGFRTQFHPGNLCDYSRALYCLQLKRVRDLGTARILVFAGRHTAVFPLPRPRSVAGAGFRRREDAC
jgi:TerC family integral membrane protein